MRQQISFLTQSRFYSPVFNSAIFDGPIRIYFSQHQESLALKVYFMVQEKMKIIYPQVRDAFRRTGINIFVMLYPSTDTFKLSFEECDAQSSPVIERLGSDFVIGVNGPIDDEDVRIICERVEEISRALMETHPPASLREVEEVGL